MWDPRAGDRCKIYFILSRQQSIDMRWYNYFSPNYRWHNSYWLIFLEFEFCEYIYYGYRYSCKIALKIFVFIWKQLLRYPYWSNFKTRSISPYSALFQASNVLLFREWPQCLWLYLNSRLQTRLKKQSTRPLKTNWFHRTKVLCRILRVVNSPDSLSVTARCVICENRSLICKNLTSGFSPK